MVSDADLLTQLVPPRFNRNCRTKLHVAVFYCNWRAACIHPDLHTASRVSRRPNEAGIARNRISSLTPMGKAVFARRVGDVVDVDAPGDVFRVRLEAVDHSVGQFARAE